MFSLVNWQVVSVMSSCDTDEAGAVRLREEDFVREDLCVDGDEEREDLCADGDEEREDLCVDGDEFRDLVLFFSFDDRVVVDNIGLVVMLLSLLLDC